MAIQFACPLCGEVLTLRDDAAGKRGRCPKCGGEITVPTQPPAPAGPAAKPEVKTCPDCSSPLPPRAVICVQCGLNLKTGKKLKTVFEEPEEPQNESEGGGTTQ